MSYNCELSYNCKPSQFLSCRAEINKLKYSHYAITYEQNYTMTNNEERKRTKETLQRIKKIWKKFNNS